jgi:hypothetical protein
MNPTVTTYLSDLHLGSMQSFQNMDVIPIFATHNGGTEYITLKEALDKDIITITELNQSGSVPELKVVNKSAELILLLDGEELIGAKQNRVLNTSVLLKGNSETIIPVSCTEQGRWSYRSEAFADSDAMLASKVRLKKVRSVSASLRQDQSYSSDQGAVWQDIQEMHSKANVKSSTGAMKDVYTSRESELSQYAQSFSYVPNQQGVVVFINGKVAGMDVLSQKSAFEKIHLKLIKSYAMDAILDSTKPGTSGKDAETKTFLKEITGCRESRFASIGLGEDYRYEDKKSLGSALLFEDKVIHLAFFRSEENDSGDRMSGLSRRRGFRGGSSDIAH